MVLPHNFWRPSFTHCYLMTSQHPTPFYTSKLQKSAFSKMQHAARPHEVFTHRGLPAVSVSACKCLFLCPSSSFPYFCNRFLSDWRKHRKTTRKTHQNNKQKMRMCRNLSFPYFCNHFLSDWRKHGKTTRKTRQNNKQKMRMCRNSGGGGTVPGSTPSGKSPGGKNLQ